MPQSKSRFRCTITSVISQDLYEWLASVGVKLGEKSLSATARCVIAAMVDHDHREGNVFNRSTTRWFARPRLRREERRVSVVVGPDMSDWLQHAAFRSAYRSMSDAVRGVMQAAKEIGIMGDIDVVGEDTLLMGSDVKSKRRVVTQLTREDWDKLEEYRDKNHMSTSQAVRTILSVFLYTQGEGNG